MVDGDGDGGAKENRAKWLGGGRKKNIYKYKRTKKTNKEVQGNEQGSYKHLNQPSCQSKIDKRNKSSLTANYRVWLDHIFNLLARVHQHEHDVVHERRKRKRITNKNPPS